MANREQKDKPSGSEIVLMIKATYWLPEIITRFFIQLFSRLNDRLKWKSTRVVRRNLALCFPELDEHETNQRVKRFIQQNAFLTHEFATAWLGNRETIESKFAQVHGSELIDRCIAQKRPVIVAVPHIGNWEFFWHWLQFNYPLVGMYQPAKQLAVDELVLNARSRFGGQLFATDPKGIMGLLRALKTGKVLMILPDQAPRRGAGVYSPFFGQSAYTMTLLHKFIQKTDAQLVFGSCIRQAKGKQFDIHIEAPQFDSKLADVEAFNAAMNQQIETVINRWPDQYQWSYKRFKRQPEGKNPYA